MISLPRIAVILCTYEPNDFLFEQVKSIISQKNITVDIHIFDDGSTSQESLAILKKVAKIVFSINYCAASKSAAKNFMRSVDVLNVDDYDFVALSDQDDIWLDSKISRAIDQLTVFASAGYSSNLTIYDGITELGILKKDKPMTLLDYHFQGASAGCTYVLSKDLVNVIKQKLKNVDYMNYKGVTSHDWLFYYIARTNDFSWFMDEESKILYRQHDNNVHGAKIPFLNKLEMLFGAWYQEHILFMSLFRSKNDEFNVNGSFFYKIKFFKNIIEFRREKFNSVICYLYWLFKY